MASLPHWITETDTDQSADPRTVDNNSTKIKILITYVIEEYSTGM